MSFWNGYEWTSETSAPTPPPIPKRVGRARDYIATLVMVAAIGIYALPLVATSASTAGGPDLSLSPTSGVPGTTVTATGQSLPRRARLVLTWDGAAAGMPSFTTNSRGGFKVTFRVPKTRAGIARPRHHGADRDDPAGGDHDIDECEIKWEEAAGCPERQPGASRPVGRGGL